MATTSTSSTLVARPEGEEVGGVNEGAARFDEGVYDIGSGTGICCSAPLHSAKTEFGDFGAGATQTSIIHGVLSNGRSSLRTGATLPQGCLKAYPR